MLSMIVCTGALIVAILSWLGFGEEDEWIKEGCGGEDLSQLAMERLGTEVFLFFFFLFY